MKKLITLLISSLFLSACAFDKPLPEQVITKQEIPISVPCKVTQIPKPLFPFSDVKKTDSLHNKAKTLAAEIEIREAYEKQLKANNEACK